MGKSNGAIRGKAFGFISLDEKFAGSPALVHRARSVQFGSFAAANYITVRVFGALCDPLHVAGDAMDAIGCKTRQADERAQGGQNDPFQRTARTGARCMNDRPQAHSPMVHILFCRDRWRQD